MNGPGLEERRTPPPKTKLKFRSDYAILAFLCVALAGSLSFAWYQHRSAAQLLSSRDQLAMSLNQTRAEVDTMAAQIRDLIVPLMAKPPTFQRMKTAVR